MWWEFWSAFFIFLRCHKTDFAFLWHAGENEYRQKAFRSHAEKWCCRYPGGFQRRGGEACLWHTILLARSSVLYLLFREAGKGVMSPFRTAHLYPLKTAAKTAKGWAEFGCCFHEGSEGEMQWSMSFRRNKRYIKAPVSRPAAAPFLKKMLSDW